MTNEEIGKHVAIENISKSVKRRRRKWQGHILRIEEKIRHTYTTLAWTSQGNRKEGQTIGDVETRNAGRTTRRRKDMVWRYPDLHKTGLAGELLLMSYAPED